MFLPIYWLRQSELYGKLQNAAYFGGGEGYVLSSKIDFLYEDSVIVENGRMKKMADAE